MFCVVAGKMSVECAVPAVSASLGPPWPLKTTSGQMRILHLENMRKVFEVFDVPLHLFVNEWLFVLPSVWSEKYETYATGSLYVR